jgi:polyisoprenoid-binding protein YceI
VRRRTKLLALATGVVVVVGGVVVVGPAVYAHVVNANADPLPTLGLTVPPTAGPARAAPDGTWTVGAGSFAGYRVHEVLEGHGATVTGRTSDVTGKVAVTSGRVTSGTVSVDVASIHTDEAPRDAYFRSTALDTSMFPTASFTLTAPVAMRSGSPTLAGRLTVHGVTHDVSVAAQVAVAGDRAQVVASVPVTWSDYGVQAPHLGFVTVAASGAIELRLDLAAP